MGCNCGGGNKLKSIKHASLSSVEIKRRAVKRTALLKKRQLQKSRSLPKKPVVKTI